MLQTKYDETSNLKRSQIVRERQANTQPMLLPPPSPSRDYFFLPFLLGVLCSTDNRIQPGLGFRSVMPRRSAYLARCRLRRGSRPAQTRRLAPSSRGLDSGCSGSEGPWDDRLSRRTRGGSRGGERGGRGRRESGRRRHARGKGLAEGAEEAFLCRVYDSRSDRGHVYM